MSTRGHFIRILGMLAVTGVAVFLGYYFAYEPLKFRYLIHRVEAARTADEEKRAFTLAADWGRVWQVHRLRAEDAAAAGKPMSGDWLLRLEWLQSSPYGGGAYSAYRAVVDTNNLKILYDKKY